MWAVRRLIGCLVCVILVIAGAAEATRDHDIVPEDYFDLATFWDLAVSPDGATAAYVEGRWGTGDEGRFKDLWVVDLATGSRQRLTFDGFAAGSLAWSPGGDFIYFTGQDPHGTSDSPPHDGTTQVWRVAADGSEPLPVTRVCGGVEDYELAADGSKLIYTTEEEVVAEQWKELREQFPDLEYGHGVADLTAVWRLDLESWRSEQIRGATNVIHDIALTPRGDRLAMVTTDDNEIIFMEGWSRVEVLDLESRTIDSVTGEGWRAEHPAPYGWIENLTWSADGRALAFSVSFDGYVPWLYAAEWSGGEPRLQVLELPHPVAFSGNLVWRGMHRTLCFLGNTHARTHAFAAAEVQDGRHGAVTGLTSGDVVVDSFDFSTSGEAMAAVLATLTHVEDIYRVDAGTLKRVTNVNPQVDSWKLPQISIVSWGGADGDAVDGILELPPGHSPEDGPLPLIVELHGGPTSATAYCLRMWIYGRALMAANGYALLSPNYHGSTGYGDQFTAKLIGRENEIEVTDIKTGIDSLVKMGIADKNRIGVMGWSNGGFLTNSMITAEPDLFKAASSGAGVLDMLLQWAVEDTPGHVINFMQGLPWEKPEAYQKGSPVYGLGNVKTPTLIHVGGNDPRVPPAHSRALYRALYHYLDVPVELVVYPGEEHGLSTHDNRLAKMKWDLAWFEKYLKNAE